MTRTLTTGRRNAAAATARPSSGAPIVPRFAGHEFRRVVRMWDSTFFIVVLPAALFLMFGTTDGNPDITFGHGNVTAYVMVSMAMYGAAVATTSLAGMTAVERDAGWGRQLALTSLTTSGYYGAKVLVALIVAAMPVAIVFLTGSLVGATMERPWLWVASALLALVVAVPFALYGLATAMLFRSEAAVAAASGMLVVFAFLGNLFIPLEGTLLWVAPWTPMYGAAAIARWPLIEGANAAGAAPLVPGSDTLWFAVANLGAWTLVFLAVCVIAGRNRNRR